MHEPTPYPSAWSPLANNGCLREGTFQYRGEAHPGNSRLLAAPFGLAFIRGVPPDLDTDQVQLGFNADESVLKAYAPPSHEWLRFEAHCRGDFIEIREAREWGNGESGWFAERHVTRLQLTKSGDLAVWSAAATNHCYLCILPPEESREERWLLFPKHVE